MQKEVYFSNLNKILTWKKEIIYAYLLSNLEMWVSCKVSCFLPHHPRLRGYYHQVVARSKMGCSTSHYVQMAHCHLAILCYFWKVYLQFMLESNFLFILHPFWNKFYFSFCNVISICWLSNIILHNDIYCKKSLREKNLFKKSNSDKTWTESNIGVFTVFTVLQQGYGLCYKLSWNTVTISTLSKHTSSRHCRLFSAVSFSSLAREQDI